MSQKLKNWFWISVKYGKAVWPFVLACGIIFGVAWDREKRLYALETNYTAIHNSNLQQDEKIDRIEKSLGLVRDTLIVVTNDMAHVRLGLDTMNSNFMRIVKPIF